MKCLTLDEVKKLVKDSYKECQANGNTMTADHLLLTIVLNLNYLKEKEHE